MTAKPTTKRRSDTYPSLAQFASGYLHEDFVLDHTTAFDARDAFLRDASAGERAAFFKEASRFLADFEGHAWADMRHAFAALGGAWRPPSRAALIAVLSPASARAADARKER